MCPFGVQNCKTNGQAGFFRFRLDSVEKSRKCKTKILQVEVNPNAYWGYGLQEVMWHKSSPQARVDSPAPPLRASAFTVYPLTLLSRW